MSWCLTGVDVALGGTGVRGGTGGAGGITGHGGAGGGSRLHTGGGSGVQDRLSLITVIIESITSIGSRVTKLGRG